MADSTDFRHPRSALLREAASHLRVRQTGLPRRPATAHAWVVTAMGRVHHLGDDSRTHAMQTAALHFPSRTDLSNSRWAAETWTCGIS